MSTASQSTLLGFSATQAQSNTSNTQTNGLFGSSSSQQTPSYTSPFRLPLGTGTVTSPYVNLASSTSDKVEFLTGFGKLFNSQVHSDVTLYLGPSKFKFHAHYVILSVRTTFFDKAKAGEWEEGKTNEFHLKGGRSHALYRMLEYIYKGDYATDTRCLDGTKDDADLLKHTRVFLLADYFDVKGLKELCAQKFAKQAAWLWTADQFIESIRDVYSIPKSSGQCMRKEIYTVVQAHIEQLHEKEKFRELLNECAEFAADVVDMVLKKHAPKVQGIPNTRVFG
ncbi:hypothetical protein FQN50_006244 [Emmonsiellopsis sp. PD_5]|nr:hypothetical protein FQN50_006244 [Emmonsiellopsis sp. PD_5]